MTVGVAAQGPAWAVLAFDCLKRYPDDNSTYVQSKLQQPVDGLWFGFSGWSVRDWQLSRTPTSLLETLNMPVAIPQKLQLLYGAVNITHQLTQRAYARVANNAVTALQDEPLTPTVLAMFASPEPTIGRVDADGVVVGASNTVLSTYGSYQAMEPMESWRQGRLRCLQLLAKFSTGWPFEAITIHDGEPSHDWLRGEADLALLLRESQ